MKQSKYVGVDGCSFGWFSVGFDENGEYELEKFSEFSQLLDYFCDADLILVDIPIGLSNGPNERDCDPCARQKLGKPRSSSVFRVPTRKTVRYVAEATVKIKHKAASKFERAVAGGKGLTIQAFAILPKIAEVDTVMRNLNLEDPPSIREVHPELCFWAMNDRSTMDSSKKTELGRNERLHVLKNAEPRADEIYEDACRMYLRKEVARDDILDALVAAVTAMVGEDQLTTVPKCTQSDPKGLPMEMVYWLPDYAEESRQQKQS